MKQYDIKNAIIYLIKLMVRLLKVISDYDLYLYWVSVLLRMRSFTVRFKTRTHLTHLFWFSHEFSFSIFHRTTIMVLPIYKCAFCHPLINIIYAPLLWVCPKSRTTQMCFPLFLIK